MWSSQIDSQHFNFGTYGKGYVRPVEKKAVGQDHLPRCTRSVTFWEEKQPTTVYQASLLGAKERISL